MVKTQRFHCYGPGSFPGHVTKIPQAKKKKRLIDYNPFSPFKAHSSQESSFPRPLSKPSDQHPTQGSALELLETNYFSPPLNEETVFITSESLASSTALGKLQ